MARPNYDLEPGVRTAAVDEDAEWQRVNSYIADVLKDCYVLFAKLARLRGDFAGSELAKLDDISSKVRDMGQELAGFSKAFTEGEYSMHAKEQFGGESEIEVPADFEPTAEDFDFSPEGGEGGEPAPEEFEVPPELEEFEPEEPEEPEETKKPEKKPEKKSEKEE